MISSRTKEAPVYLTGAYRLTSSPGAWAWRSSSWCGW